MRAGFPYRLVFMLLVLGTGPGCDGPEAQGPAGETVESQFWLTDPGGDVRFARQPDGWSQGEVVTAPVMAIDRATAYQDIDGFGFSLTGGSALHLHAMSPEARAALLRELFATDGSAIGTSYLRVSIGASDLDPNVFSYNDLPSGQTDPGMTRFSLDPDRAYLIPILREILALAPGLKIMGSPWSPPTWMKDNQASVGGSLRPEYHEAYAAYFVKYVEGMAEEGIVIDAVTPQNEPLHPGNNPSLLMPADQQAEFIKSALGPAFRRAGLATKIVIYDHNADRPDYPLAILDDPVAKAYVDGTAFHLYGGEVSALSQVHDRHPDRNIYFTEQWVGAPGDLAGDLRWHVRELIIGATRNWSRTVIEWNLAADENQDPHTPGGCTRCLGAVTIRGDEVTRNPAYYVIAHAAKFVRPGSRRVKSTDVAGLPNVAFERPDGAVVLIVLNDGSFPATFGVSLGSKSWWSSLMPGAVGTYVLSP